MKRQLAAIVAADMAGYSRLMEQDEEGVLARQKTHRQELIDPEIGKRNGRIVKTTGDGLLAEFASALDAVQCALNIQRGMAGRELGNPIDKRIVYRLGINLGDVIFDEGDVFGDGVNVAARLQTLAIPGGICVSDIIHQTVGDRLGTAFRDLGIQRVKNISRPVRVWQWSPDTDRAEIEPDELALQQVVRFVTTQDQTQIAWATVGKGSPVLKAPNWLNHLDYEWRSPAWGPFLGELARSHRLIRFDQRGNGLSDWDPPEISVEAMLTDTQAVVTAAGLDKFALLGISQGCAFSIRYAVEHPEQVCCLVLYGGYLRGRLRRSGPEQRQLFEVLTAMIRDGWGSPNPIFRHFFTSTFIPDASLDVANSFDELQRVATSSENALRIWEMNAQVDVTELAKRVSVPTLVLHCIGDRVVPYDEGRQVAKMIPGAQFVELSGNNHVLLAGSPALDEFFHHLSPFLSNHANPSASTDPNTGSQ